ncbi:MAG TPA: ATP-binding protein [Polyangiaceae bacterium]
MTRTIREDLTVRAKLVALRAASAGVGMAPENTTAWDRLADELGAGASARVTFISKQGRVLGDSNVAPEALSGVESHGHRPEVANALNNDFGTSSRLSTTVNKQMLYIAVPLREHGAVVGVCRVAVPLTHVEKSMAVLRNVLAVAVILALALAVLLSSAAAHLASRSVRRLTETARALAGGNLNARSDVEGLDEYAELGRALDTLASNLSSSLRELRNERDRLSGILSGMQEGVLFLDHERNVALLNPALREMLLISPDVVGTTLGEAVQNAELRRLLECASRSNQPLTSEVQIRDLKPRHLLVRAAQLEGAEGGVFAVFVDVTEIRRLESVRRDFVANVSHELRTPVTAIRSAAETLQVAAADPKAAETFMPIIERNAERLQELVEDLLDLSRIESQKYSLKPERLDAEEVFVRVAGLFRERAARRRVSIEYQVARGALELWADPKAIEHVFTNLVDNAVKYAGDGAKVRLRAEAAEDGVVLSVEDDGPGIAKAHLPRLFERFYRVDTGRSRDLGGTGLGLSIVKHLVESMGGSIGVESQEGRGTSFLVRLPSAAAYESWRPPAA